MDTRLSRKAQDHAAMLSARLDAIVRQIASRLAKERGAEFADEIDVNKAYAAAILNAAEMLCLPSTDESGGGK